jgi:hypothetical protein
MLYALRTTSATQGVSPHRLLSRPRERHGGEPGAGGEAREPEVNSTDPPHGERALACHKARQAPRAHVSKQERRHHALVAPLRVLGHFW